MEEHGFAEGEHPYPLLFSRPPGGNPFLGKWERRGREDYSRAVRELGMLNIMWHHNSQDSDPALEPKVRYDTDRIVGTIMKTARRGGVWVAHDRGPSEPVKVGLAKLANDPKYKVVPLQELLEAKYQCPLEAIADDIAQHRKPKPENTKSSPPTASADDEAAGSASTTASPAQGSL
jgi:hypothetical protein